MALRWLAAMTSAPISLNHQALALLTLLLLEGLDYHNEDGATGDLWCELLTAARSEEISDAKLHFWASCLQDLAKSAAMYGVNQHDENAVVFLTLYAFCQPSTDRLKEAATPLALARAWKNGKPWAELDDEGRALDDLWVMASWVANPPAVQA